MKTTVVATTIFFIYAGVDQWAFRLQRVGRGILLLAKDSAAQYPDLFSAIMPTSYFNAMWLKRGLWLICLYCGWQAWRWYGIAAILLYGTFATTVVDLLSPWPSYTSLLSAIKQRIRLGRAGYDAMLLLPCIAHIEDEMRRGVSYERATTGEWIGRAFTAGQMTAQRYQRVPSDDSPGNTPTEDHT